MKILNSKETELERTPESTYARRKMSPTYKPATARANGKRSFAQKNHARGNCVMRPAVPAQTMPARSMVPHAAFFCSPMCCGTVIGPEVR